MRGQTCSLYIFKNDIFTAIGCDKYNAVLFTYSDSFIYSIYAFYLYTLIHQVINQDFIYTGN